MGPAAVTHMRNRPAQVSNNGIPPLRHIVSRMVHGEFSAFNPLLPPSVRGAARDAVRRWTGKGPSPGVPVVDAGRRAGSVSSQSDILFDTPRRAITLEVC
ncbi:hypothetical protein GCM10023223_03880 [Stackebrandtia albiflava]